jgi:hypothetical protein
MLSETRPGALIGCAFDDAERAGTSSWSEGIDRTLIFDEPDSLSQACRGCKEDDGQLVRRDEDKFPVWICRVYCLGFEC